MVKPVNAKVLTNGMDDHRHREAEGVPGHSPPPQAGWSTSHVTLEAWYRNDQDTDIGCIRIRRPDVDSIYCYHGDSLADVVGDVVEHLGTSDITVQVPYDMRLEIAEAILRHPAVNLRIRGAALPLDRFNIAVSDLMSVAADIANNIQCYVDDKSEKWAESERGEMTMEWLAEYENYTAEDWYPDVLRTEPCPQLAIPDPPEDLSAFSEEACL